MYVVGWFGIYSHPYWKPHFVDIYAIFVHSFCRKFGGMVFLIFSTTRLVCCVDVYNVMISEAHIHTSWPHEMYDEKRYIIFVHTHTHMKRELQVLFYIYIYYHASIKFTYKYGKHTICKLCRNVINISSDLNANLRSSSSCFFFFLFF